MNFAVTTSNFQTLGRASPKFSAKRFQSICPGLLSYFKMDMEIQRPTAESFLPFVLEDAFITEKEPKTLTLFPIKPGFGESASSHYHRQIDEGSRGAGSSSSSAVACDECDEDVLPISAGLSPINGQDLAGQAAAAAASLVSGHNRRLSRRSSFRKSSRHGPRPKSSSFKGVTYYKRTGRWEAHIWNAGKQIYLGASSTAEKAARAYDRAVLHFRGIGADLNFKLEDYTNELRRLLEISENDLVSMLRKQSAGNGRPEPDYPTI